MTTTATAAVTSAGERDALNRARLSIGFNLTGCVLVAFQLTVMLLNLEQYPDLPFTIGAWTLFVASLIAGLFVRQRYPDRLPGWIFGSALGAWAVVVGLDVAGTWSPGDGDSAPLTAAVAVGAGLLLCVTLRPARDIVIPSIALGFVLAAAFALHGQHDQLALGPAFVTIALSVAPPLLGVQIVRSLRTVVQLELDLVQVQSTVSSPRFAVGMLASEELARLDLAAERLLDGVATGRTPLPLDEETASAASSIATELRLHLIQGRRETWLYHAVTESALLGPAVTVNDTDGLAGLLNRDQRDGLLTAIWLLISDPVRQGQVQNRDLQVTVEPRIREPGMDPSAAARIPITISTTGVPRNGVDPAAWQAIRKVGRYVETFAGTTLRIDIESVIDNQSDL